MPTPTVPRSLPRVCFLEAWPEEKGDGGGEAKRGVAEMDGEEVEEVAEEEAGGGGSIAPIISSRSERISASS